jgi:hypothetical protein
MAAGISRTGAGSIIAGIWFIADFGTATFNYFMYDDFTGLGDC